MGTAPQPSYFAAMKGTEPFFHAFTGPDGFYEIAGIEFQGETWVDVTTDGFGPVGATVKIVPSVDMTDIDFFLPLGASIAGRILTHDGDPADDAMIQAVIQMLSRRSGAGLVGPSGRPFAYTDSAGEFAMSFHADITGCALVVRSPRHGTASFTDIEFPVDDYLELRMGGAATRRGRLTHSDGTPATGL